jgi:hypothetical protein
MKLSEKNEMNKKMALPKLKRGDMVKWISQSRGITRLKKGEVVQVVPAGDKPRVSQLLDRYVVRSSAFGSNLPRNMKSFVVAVPQGKGKTSKIYWPLSRNLRKIN